MEGTGGVDLAIEIFNRYEKKYMIDAGIYDTLIQELSEYMEPDKHCLNGNHYSICNIYYDTDTDELIRRSIEKPIYKEKLRLRSYGKPDDDSEAFIEIKKKYKGIVNKRRTTMTLKQALDYLENGVYPESENISRQVMNEIAYFISYYTVKPKVYISYDRVALFGKDDDSFRVTFDTNIQTRREDLDLRKGAYGKQLLPEGKILMEAKISGGFPLWFSRIITKHGIYPASFSKYGTEYKNYFIINKGELNYV